MDQLQYKKYVNPMDTRVKLLQYLSMLARQTKGEKSFAPFLRVAGPEVACRRAAALTTFYVVYGVQALHLTATVALGHQYQLL